VTSKLKTAKTNLGRARARVMFCLARARGAPLAAMLFFLARVHAQTLPPGANASDFSSVEYYDAPNQQQVKSQISGASAQPIEGGLLLIKHVKLERFLVDGKPQLIVTAPECVFNPMTGQANSPGEVHMQTGDKSLQIEGQGFLWRQSESFLIISNHVQTIIEKTPAIAP
jgi:hypothetical protein